MDMGDSVIRIRQTLIMGVFKVGGNFATTEQRKVLAKIAIQVEDLLISGIDVLASTFAMRMNENSRKISIRGIKRPIGEWNLGK